MQPVVKFTDVISTDGVKMLVYGQAGVGKTRAIATLPAPITLSAEAGLLSLATFKLPYIEIADFAAVVDAFNWLKSSEEAKQYQSVAIDSISEIAEIVLTSEKAKTKDPRQAYGTMQDIMRSMITSFRNLKGKHIYFTAKLEQKADETGRQIYCPTMPGQKTGRDIPYALDEVFAMATSKDDNGNIQRALRCWPDLMWTAKDRSGKLNEWEPADLGAIIAKITGKDTKGA